MLTPWCDWCGRDDCPDCNPPAKSAEQIAAEVHAIMNTPPITFTREQLGVDLDAFARIGATLGAAAARQLDRTLLAELDAARAPAPVIVLQPEPFVPAYALAWYSAPAHRPYLHGLILGLGLDEPTVVFAEGRAVGKSEELRGVLTLGAEHDELLAKAVAQLVAEPLPAPAKPRPPQPLPARPPAPRAAAPLPIRYCGIRRKGSRNA